MVRRKVKFEKENKLLMIGRKILLVLITTFIGILTANWLASFLPQYYESTSLLGCVPPIISGGSNIGICSEEDVSQRLNSLNAEVLSNSSLEPIIKKYNVGANKKLPIEIQVEQMRKRILVKPEKTENKHLFAFRVSYRDENPETARNIVKELADKFVEVVSIPDSIGCSMNGLLEKQIEELLERSNRVVFSRPLVTSKGSRADPEKNSAPDSPNSTPPTEEVKPLMRLEIGSFCDRIL